MPTEEKIIPTYCYKTDAGYGYEQDFPRGEAPEFIEVLRPDAPLYKFFGDHNDYAVKKWLVKAYRDYRAEAVTGTVVATRNHRQGWPMKPCYASGVHASQAGELRDHFKRHGVSVDVTDSGDPIYTSAAQRKQALKCRGMHDKSSFD